MEILFGTVSEIVDYKKFVIRFTIEGLIDNMTAYPISVDDEPQIGDPVVIFKSENIFGYNFMYQKQKLADYIRMKLKGAEIDITEDSVVISSEGKTASSTIIVSNDGSINIKSTSAINVSSKTKIELDAPIVKCEGRVIPDGNGPFCAVDVCPVSGLPLRGSTVIKG